MDQNRLINGALGVVSISAVVLTATAIAVTLRPRVVKESLSIEKVSDWREISSQGHRDGPVNAAVMITEFADFQCPYCATISKDLKALRMKYPTTLAIVYRHLPLERIHAEARNAALASECAAEQVKFFQYADALFTSQEKIGVLSWAQFASQAGVPDTSEFGACLARMKTSVNLERDIETANRLGIRVTPTLLVNHRRFPVPPTALVLDSLIQADIRSREMR